MLGVTDQQVLSDLTPWVVFVTAVLGLVVTLGKVQPGPLWRRPSHPVRPIVATALRLPRRTEDPAVRARRPIVVRRLLFGGAVYALASIGGLALLHLAGSPLWATTLMSLALLYVALVLAAGGINVETPNAKRSALSRHCHTTEVDLLGKPLDVLADWQALVASMRFELESLYYDDATGRLALTCTRLRLLRPTGLMQYVAVYGCTREDALSSFTVLVDSVIPLRRDFGGNQATIERILQHFSLPYEGDG